MKYKINRKNLQRFLDLLDQSIEKDFSNCFLYTPEQLEKDKKLLSSLLDNKAT